MKKVTILLILMTLVSLFSFALSDPKTELGNILVNQPTAHFIHFFACALIAVIILLVGFIFSVKETRPFKIVIFYVSVIVGAGIGILLSNIFGKAIGSIFGGVFAGFLCSISDETWTIYLALLVGVISGFAFIGKEDLIFNFLLVPSICLTDIFFRMLYLKYKPKKISGSLMEGLSKKEQKRVLRNPQINPDE